MEKIKLFFDGVKSIFSKPPNKKITFKGRILWHLWKVQCFLYNWIPRKIWTKIYTKQ